MNYLLDTNICIYFLSGKFDLAEKIEKIGLNNLFISEITVAELKFGAEKSDYPERNRTVVNQLAEKFQVMPIYSALDIYAKEKARLRKEGNTVDDLDLFISATAIVNEMVMVTNNEKHLARMNGIEIENWTK